MALTNLPYPNMDFTPLDILTADELDHIVANYTAINNAEIYPVGSIYISVNSTNPSTYFGGTWERIQDTFLLAAGSTYSAGSTGGEATHTLTVSEMPSHRHTLGSTNGSVGYTETVSLGNSSQASHTSYSSFVGGGQAHNNMPPYLAVYVWKRTA